MPRFPVPAVLSLLFAGAFVMGSAEMLVVGLLDLIAADLRVSAPAAGALVTANAIGLALGGPLLTLATARIGRRTVLIGAILVFLVATLPPLLGTDLAPFLVLRVIAGAAQGLYIAAAITLATTISPPERAGRAMGIVISGFASASALGLPLGTLLGQSTGWRGAYAAVVAVGAVLLLLSLAMVPATPAPPAEGGALGLLRHALSPRVLLVLTIGLVLFAGSQSAVTYLVPLLAERSGVDGAGVSAYLLAYGVATTGGSFLGGRFADRDAGSALTAGALGVTASLILLQLLGSFPVGVFAAILGIGFFLMSAAPAMQHRVAALSGPGGPLAAALPASAVNVGIALGSAAGGWTIDAAGIGYVAITGAVLAAAAAVLALVARPRRRPADLVASA